MRDALSPRATGLLLGGITLAGGLLRVWALGAKSLWLDEAFSIWLAWQPLDELWAWLVRIDQHPPLYYTLLWLWLRVGDDAGTVRLLSALCSTATIPVLFAIGRRLGGPALGLTAALILALAPFHVRFAQEARMYALLTLNAGLALLMLVYLLADPGASSWPVGSQLLAWLRWRSAPAGTARPGVGTDLAWVGYVVFTAATWLTHNTAVFFGVAVNVAVVGLIAGRRVRAANIDPKDPTYPTDQVIRPPSWANWWKAQVGVLLLWSLWLPAFLVQSRLVFGEFWILPPTLETVWTAVETFLVAFLPLAMPGEALVWALFGGLLVLAFVHWRRQPATLYVLAALFVTPFVGELVVSVWRPIFYERTLIWTTLPLYVLLAAGIVQVGRRPLVVAALVLLVALDGLGLRSYFVDFQKEEWREAAAYVAAQVRDDDLILFNATWVQLPFDYYFEDYDRPVARHGAPVDLFARGVLEPKMAAADVPRLRSLVAGHRRVWLVYSHDWYTDPQGIVPRVLEETLDLRERRRFEGLELRRYDSPE